jgi:hypothetical protein
MSWLLALKLDFILDISRIIFYSGMQKNDNFSRSERLKTRQQFFIWTS